MNQIRFRPGQATTIKTVGSIEKSKNMLTIKERKALRIEKIKDLIRSKPAGTHITLADFKEATNVGHDSTMLLLLNEIAANGIIKKHPTPNHKARFYYTVTEDVKAKPPIEPTYTPPAPVTEEKLELATDNAPKPRPPIAIAPEGWLLDQAKDYVLTKLAKDVTVGELLEHINK